MLIDIKSMFIDIKSMLIDIKIILILNRYYPILKRYSSTSIDIHRHPSIFIDIHRYSSISNRYPSKLNRYIYILIDSRNPKVYYASYIPCLRHFQPFLLTALPDIQTNKCLNDLSTPSPPLTFPNVTKPSFLNL